VVVCLELGADVLHMVQLMSLPSQSTTTTTTFTTAFDVCLTGFPFPELLQVG